ncbi:ASCH domain-containing protein [Thermopirellula anaerolimosa]
MLLFKKKFMDAIRNGTKTQTIRLWKWRRMKEGQKSYIPGAGYIVIDEVAEVRLEDLTDDDARPDGFATAADLRAEIAQLYPTAEADGYRAFRVRFHVCPPEEQVRLREASRLRKARRRKKSLESQSESVEETTADGPD